MARSRAIIFRALKHRKPTSYHWNLSSRESLIFIHFHFRAASAFSRRDVRKWPHAPRRSSRDAAAKPPGIVPQDEDRTIQSSCLSSITKSFGGGRRPWNAVRIAKSAPGLALAHLAQRVGQDDCFNMLDGHLAGRIRAAFSPLEI